MSHPEPQLNSLYQQLILEHYRSPRNKGELEGDPIEIHMRNPTCGDEIKLQVHVEDDRIADVRFTGQGCSISQAAVSMMTQLLKDQPLERAELVTEKFTALMHGDDSLARDKDLGDLRALAGVSKFPVRVKCALLGFDALQEALKTLGDSATED